MEMCPACGGTVIKYGQVKRIVRGENGSCSWIKVQRFQCHSCDNTYRKLPETLLPYKHYEAKIILGFISGELTSFEFDYEDYPCESTIRYWIGAHRLQAL